MTKALNLSAKMARLGEVSLSGAKLRGAIAWQSVLRRGFAPSEKIFSGLQNFSGTAFVVLTRGGERNNGCVFRQKKPARQILILRPSPLAASSNVVGQPAEVALLSADACHERRTISAGCDTGRESQQEAMNGN